MSTPPHLRDGPYPGLRPYTDAEAALLFGRVRQVHEIVERLASSQFVTVLGGSGSGKSSLVTAGVVPELRSYGIPGAGDLWLPMTCTPGTNTMAHASGSPVTRLAQRFARLLVSRGSAEADAARRVEIAEVFRQEAGFARLLDAYGQEFEIPPGPDPVDARVLFVLDQFEEVFHPTNRGLADVDILIERVLDHFFNPHPRCFVVLTMRSEYLNHCAAYLELPDAINTSSYLVRRLDDGELREAITAPAQRFLRRAQRLDMGRALPREVRFDNDVVDRVLRDAREIAHDPDHLPLLQHLLARLWQAALEREQIDELVPSRIISHDLVRAVSATTSDRELDDAVNTLRASVNNWPERIFQGLRWDRRDQLDALLRRLAVRDPDTGHYVQQRLAVDEAGRLLGETTLDGRRILLDEGFLGGVDYLFWDDDDPTQATLKVSHESFIRGWAHFRSLVDEEARRFERFGDLVRRCAAWTDGKRSEDLLLEANEAQRLLGDGLGAALADPARSTREERLLELGRDGARLVSALPALHDFVAESLQHHHLLRQRMRHRRMLALTTPISLLLMLVVASYWILVQAPTLQRMDLSLRGANLARSVPPGLDVSRADDAKSALGVLLRAAALVDAARTASDGSLVAQLGWFGPVRRQLDLSDAVSAQSEAQVNTNLRDLLSRATWYGTSVGEAHPPAAADGVMPVSQARELPGSPDRGTFEALVPAPAASPCGQLAKGVSRVSSAQAFESRAGCIVVRSSLLEHADTGTAPSQGTGDTGKWVELAVALYPKPALSPPYRLYGDNLPAPIAQLPRFARLPVWPDAHTLRWSLGTRGEHAGWLVLELPLGSGGEGKPEWVGLPLTTCALWRVGVTLSPERPAGPAVGDCASL